MPANRRGDVTQLPRATVALATGGPCAKLAWPISPRQMAQPARIKKGVFLSITHCLGARLFLLQAGLMWAINCRKVTPCKDFISPPIFRVANVTRTG